MLLASLDVVGVDPDVAVSVRPRLLVPKADRVADLVSDDPFL